MTVDELKAICDLTVKLTELRLRECPHLCIENYAPELFGSLLQAHTPTVESYVTMSVGGLMRSDG